MSNDSRPGAGQNQHIGPGERYLQAATGRIYIQSSERSQSGERVRTRLYDDGTVQADRFGTDGPAGKHPHDIDDARLGRDEEWRRSYRRAQGGDVTFDRDADAKRRSLVDEASTLSRDGCLSEADARRLAARWRNAGSTSDPERDRQLEQAFRQHVPIQERRGRGR